MSVTRLYAAEAVTAALSAESCCKPSDFHSEGVRVFELTPGRASNPLARRFSALENTLTIMSMGAGIVVAATPELMPWASELFLDAKDADDAFSLRILSEASRRAEDSSLRLNGPYAYNVTSEQDWVNRRAPDGYVVEVGGAELLAGLEPADWPNAVAPRRASQGRLEAVAALALHDDEVVGVASASTDSDTLWQIGIDVHSNYRGRGLGAALTSRVARGVLDAGRVPYYGSSINNIASRRTAQSAGFYPSWVSVFTTGS
ncbi:MAG: GNAT family N-acetyltransferase [Chloroflexi bacterium]|nr:GNAT family N-acetyltransferase [Chloroflexota bacterium]